MKISVVSGGFDPIHSGHINYISAAKKMGDLLIVMLNSDEWLKDKKGKPFMPFSERKQILENIKDVDKVIGFKDDQVGSCINGLEKIKSEYPNDTIIFCNGGDRKKDNIPEMQVQGIKFEFGVGGNNKDNSSSWILKDWKYESEERVWGNFYTLFSDSRVKLKELTIIPSKGMSMQRHTLRDEIWFISSGRCKVNFSKNSPEDFDEILLKKDDIFSVKRSEWHQIFNPYEEECKILEIQYGEKTSEDDIERYKYFSNDDLK
jgi:cytidyltransferase-like protein